MTDMRHPLQTHERGALFSGRELLLLGLLALPLLVTTSAMETADWIEGLPSLRLLAVISLFVWALAARTNLPGVAVHLLAFLVGLGAAFLLGSWTIGEHAGPADLARELSTWTRAIGSVDGDEGDGLVGIGLIAITIWTAYATAWLAYRRRKALLATLPGLIVLLVVLAYLPEEHYWRLLIFSLAASPGVFYRRDGLWNRTKTKVSLATAAFASAAITGTAIVLVWYMPAPSQPVIPVAATFEDPLYSLEENWSILFQGVPNRKETLSFHSPRDLPIGEPGELGDDVLMEVESSDPYRWRMRVYETYSKLGWLSEQPPVLTPTDEISIQASEELLLARENVKINVKMHSSSNVLLSVGEPLSASIATKTELSPPPFFPADLDGEQRSYLPPELLPFTDGLDTWISSDETADLAGVLGSPEWVVYPGHQAPETLINDLRTSNVDVKSADETVALSFYRIGGADAPYLLLRRSDAAASAPLALLGSRILTPPRRYTTVGSVSTATPAMLRSAGNNYPAPVTDRYLQLPPDFPESVEELAKDLTSGSTSAYDMAEAIRQHLISLPYTTDVSLPPPGEDWVEHFLFVERRGFCHNFASAMVTMLRSLGIPARLVTGMAPGSPIDDGTTFEVQTKNYHAWPEVYFPNYGWVEFEPTPTGVQESLAQLGVDEGAGRVSDSVATDDCLLEFSPAECEALGRPENADSEDVFLDDEGRGRNGTGLAASPSPTSGGIYLPSGWIYLAILIGVAVMVPLELAYYLWRSGSKGGYVVYSYTSMCLLGRLGGIRRRSQETPWEYSSRLIAVIPDRAEEIRYVTDRFVNARYGGSHRRYYAQEMWSLRAAWPPVRRGLLKLIISRLVLRLAFRSDPKPKPKWNLHGWWDKYWLERL